MSESVATALDTVRRGGRWFFGVPLRRQTYRNLLYLLLAFPLGIAYFTFLVTGLTTSIVLLFVLVGIPMLGFTLFMIIELAAFERFLAERLLRVEIPTSESPDDVREWLRRLVLDRSPWLGAVYLFSKFAAGIVTFVLLVFGLTFTYTLVSAPFHYREETVGIHVADPIEFIPAVSYQHNGWTLDLVAPITIAIADGELISIYVDSVASALLVSAVGVLVGLATLHVFNAVAWLYGRYTALLLGRTQRSSIGRFVLWGDDGAGGSRRDPADDDDGPAGADGDGSTGTDDDDGPAGADGDGSTGTNGTPEPGYGDEGESNSRDGDGTEPV